LVKLPRNANSAIRPFKLPDLLAVSNPTETGSGHWLVGAEDSIHFVRQNASNDEIVIYASTRGFLVHGVLGLTRKLTQESIAELQNRIIPMLDDSWSIQRVWGGGQGH
jgi:hypothetical protein